MKKYALSLALVSVAALQGCNEGTNSATNASVAAPAEVTLETSEQRVSYGIAFNVGSRMTAEGVPLDIDVFMAGMEDALRGNTPRMTIEEMQAELQAFQTKMLAEREQAQSAMAEANKAAAETFLKENAAREGVVVTESGLQYEVIEPGEGAKPGPQDTVEVHYRGTLVDGTEFDSSHARGEPVTFGVGQVIPGWTEALQLMSPGSKYKLAIPSELAYGQGGAGQLIGPNAALIFEVELLSIPSQAAEAAEDKAEG